MKTGIKVILCILGLVVLLCGLELATGYFGVFYTKTVGKAQENAKREVYKETQSYNDGMAQELVKIKTEYDQAKDSIDKNALKYRIQHEYANFDEQKLESESLKNWLIKIRGF